MDEGFCREQVQRIRALAERADPFTKRRLLALVSRYERKRIVRRGARRSAGHRLCALRRRYRSSGGQARHDLAG